MAVILPKIRKGYIIFEDDETRVSILRKKNKYLIQIDQINIRHIGSTRACKTYTHENNFTITDKNIINSILTHYELDNKFMIYDKLPNHIMIY